MVNKVNVLMTGAGAPGGPGIIKAINSDTRFNLITCDMNQNASGRFLSDIFIQVPSAKSPDFISKMLDICKKYKIDVIFPLVTLELFEFSKNKELFLSLGVVVVVSDFDTLSLLNDKGKLYQSLKGIVPLPHFEVSNDINAIERFADNIGYPSVPFVFKPCVSNGSRGVRIIDSSVDAFSLLFEHKPNSLYTSLSTLQSVLSNRILPEFVLSSYLPGKEITVDSIVKNGKVLEVLVRERTTMNSGISTSGRFIHNDQVENYIHKIVNNFPGLSGPIGFQLKQDIDGTFLLIESNPRIQGTSVAAIGVGVNLPVYALCISLDLPYNFKKNYNKNSFSRYYSEVYY